MKPLFLFILLFLSIFSFSQENYSIAAIPAHLTVSANSVVLDEKIEVDVSDIARMTIKKLKVVAVLNKLGNDDIDLREYYNENSKVKKIGVRVYDMKGKEIKRFKKRDFVDVNRVDGNMYVDARVLYLNYTPVQYPYIIAFESEISSGDSAFIPPWIPLGDYAESTRKSVYKLIFDPNNKPKYKTSNLEGLDVRIDERPSEFVFTATNLKALRYEEHSPQIYELRPNVLFGLEEFYLKGTLGSAKNWEDFGRWMDEALLYDVGELSENTLVQVRQLVANETTNEAKARKIYQFLQDKVRYISIQIGIGGWKPMPASAVDRLSYGDCKALTNYTKALLDAVGVPSYYTVLYGSQSKRDIKTDFVSMQGNHVILGIPDGDKITWLECTSQDLPYGYIGSMTDDRNVLILTPEGGKIVHTKIYDAAESRQENIARVKIAQDGELMADFSGVSEGIQYENKIYIPKKRPDEIERFYKKRWSHINGMKLSDIKFDDNREKVIFTETMAIKIPHYSDQVGKDFLFCLNIFNRLSYIPPRVKDRKQNLYIGNGFTDVDTIEIELPSNLIFEAIPDDTLVETKFGTYEINFSKEDNNKLLYQRTLQIKKGEYPPSDYEEYRDFLSNIVRLDKTKLLLKQILD